MTRLLQEVQMPPRVAALPRNKAGYPIAYFVAHLPDGTRDFRIAGQEQHVLALGNELCWVCGGGLDGLLAFTIGPMCAVNRISAEPPSHPDCATYAARVCPFLSNPEMVRRPHGYERMIPAAGDTISRNPGVALVWVTRSFEVFEPEMGASGMLCELGVPVETAWWCRGRPATYSEVLESIASGLPELVKACQQDEDPAESMKDLGMALRAIQPLLPGAVGVPC